MAESKRFLLRLDPDLFEVLRRWADDDLRSINAQIEYLLGDQARRAGRLRGRPRRRPVAEAEDPDDDGGTEPARASTGRERKVASRARTE